MKQNVILSYCAGYNLEQIESFVASWKKNAQSARLLMFHTNMTTAIMEVLTDVGVEFVDIENYWPSPYRGITLRFKMWRDYMRQFGHQFGKVMVTDVRDVIFQTDPFLLKNYNRVVWASEDKSIKSDPEWNLRWLVELFGLEVVDTFSNQLASCCGTTLGDRGEMTAYLEDMWALIESTKFDQMGVYEQGFHNYLVHKIKPAYGFLDLDFTFFGTLGTISPSRISIINDIIAIDGRPIPVIHQWDRHLKLIEHLKSSSSYRLSA